MKGIREEFARFFEEPSRETLRDLLRNNFGEFAYLDFKQEWPASPKLARHMLGLANSSGGCLVIGVVEEKDNTLEPKGLESLTDKVDIRKGIKKFLPHTLLAELEIFDFPFPDSEYPAIVGKKFQVALIEDDPEHLPFLATRSSGSGIRDSAVYVRRGASTVEANHAELQNVINRRLETGYSSQREIDLQTHLEQLKVLFRQVDRYHLEGGYVDHIRSLSRQLATGDAQKVPNPRYPKEDFEGFVVSMIAVKKARIAAELSVYDLWSQREDEGS